MLAGANRTLRGGRIFGCTELDPVRHLECLTLDIKCAHAHEHGTEQEGAQVV